MFWNIEEVKLQLRMEGIRNNKLHHKKNTSASKNAILIILEDSGSMLGVGS